MAHLEFKANQCPIINKTTMKGNALNCSATKQNPAYKNYGLTACTVQ